MVDYPATARPRSGVNASRICRSIAPLARFSALLPAMVLVLGCKSNQHAVPDEVVQAHWPRANLAEFVFARLDLTTFRNSTGDQRERGQRFFPELGIRPTKISADLAMHDAKDDWLYEVRVLGRRDFNGDKVEDVAICFTDKAQNGGTYSTRKPLLLELIGGRAVALDYEIDTDPEAEECQPSQ